MHPLSSSKLNQLLFWQKKEQAGKLSLLNAVGIGLELAVPRFHKGLFDGFSV